MCFYNERKTKQCKVKPNHTFKEIKLCEDAIERGSVECPEETWTNMSAAMTTTTSIACALCNGVKYKIQEPEQKAGAA
jgi:hypothetical protein